MSMCKTCGMYGLLNCRETVGVCDHCGQRADVYMDYSETGDRERPNQTICLDCLDAGVHIEAAHEVAPAPKRRASRGPKPVVTYQGASYTCKAWKVEIPDLDAMERTEALFWLLRNTIPKGVSNRPAPPNLAGLNLVVR